MNDSQGYDENSIRILDVSAQRERFSFAAAVALNQDYPATPVEVIHRMLNAALFAGVDRDLVVRRYLDGDRTVTLPPEFAMAYKDLMIEERARG